MTGLSLILLRNWIINKDIQIGREGGIIGRTIPQIELDGVCENLTNICQQPLPHQKNQGIKGGGLLLFLPPE